MKPAMNVYRWMPIAAAIAALATIAPGAQADASTQMLLVHGYGAATTGKDCNGSTWENALAYYQSAGGRPRSSMTTIGYYPGDGGRCDVMLGDGQASNERPIQDIARDLALYIDQTYTSTGRPVNIVAHSMGGLVTRVALLGSAQRWTGFPGHKLNVPNVVTLGTPHNGVARPDSRDTTQWQQMRPGSVFLQRLHQHGSGLGDPWARGTDWSLVGSRGDTTVSYASAIDRGRHADQKFGYWSKAIGHEALRTLAGNDRHRLTYWHASGDHGPHTTGHGWSPLKAALRAAARKGDGLPR